MRELKLLTAGDVSALLQDRDAELVDIVRAAYVAHGSGKTVLPESSFLRIGNASERIIALPGFIDDGNPLAGVKWIASFPGNVELGLDRASATIILNCTESGHPIAILESSIISARRTAASAALAASVLHAGPSNGVGVIGCGIIAFEVVRFLRACMPGVERLVLHDLVPARASGLAVRCADELGIRNASIVESAQSVFDQTDLVVLATTAVRPHIDEIRRWSAASTVLHVSLRDLSAPLIASADNVVDAVDHVLRASTSLDLAVSQYGHKDFLRCELHEVLAARQAPRTPGTPLVFSPFGLGILDLAVARMVLRRAREAGVGHDIPNFLPAPWSRPS